MKTRGLKMENGGWPTRSALECGGKVRRTGIFVATEIKNHFSSVGAPSPAGQTEYAAPLGLKLILSLMLQRFRTYGAGTGRTILVALCFFSLNSAIFLRAFAQNYSIDWHKITAGGGTSTNGQYAVSGTIGQPDASAQSMTEGSYALTGGFWSLISVMQTAGLPNLTITHSGNSVIVSWPATGSYTLQQTANLAAGGWATSGYTITTANGTNSITVTPPTGNLFFRLAQ